jgi:hypothetical protein
MVQSMPLVIISFSLFLSRLSWLPLASLTEDDLLGAHNGEELAYAKG